MERWYGIDQIPGDLTASVVTIGNFDGVHLGHRTVLSDVVTTARTYGASAVAVTFDPHPAAVHRPDAAPELLTGLDDRLDLMAETGIDACVVIEYTPGFAVQSPEEFVRHYLVEALRVRCVVVGEDVRFGQDNSGDRATMAQLGERLGFDVRLVEDVTAPDRRRWSSTWVRELLAAGDCAGATAVLGRAHRMRGVVVHGQARGRELGFPTANLAASASGTVPADGVYAGWLIRDRKAVPPGAPMRWPAAVSIGTNPTFDGTKRQVEAHVLGRRDLDLYGEEIVVEFVRRLRPTVRFEGIEELVAQMREDVIDAADVLDVPRPDVLPAVQ
ncbi:bifunctional riboflavin kinase/FAD synthetase [Ruania halotolerans]|uniref:bifunctional riboflavin kinase/FAD synthetase n=1 Tax=Ruania halotolerans TaxID=2897773 RepID=UPI003F491DBA